MAEPSCFRMAASAPTVIDLIGSVPTVVSRTLRMPCEDYGFFNQADEARLTISRCRAAAADYICAHPTNPQTRKTAMTIAIGDKVPDVKLSKATENGPEPVQSADFFKGRRVALFSVPGAFTPTCSAKHLPGFVEKAAELKAKGIDEIACTAVNDGFVMGAWGRASGSTDVTMLADGNGDFAHALGLPLDLTSGGLGKRGQRFSMVVNDGVVEQLNVEGPGEFRVSSAEHLLEQL